MEYIVAVFFVVTISLIYSLKNLLKKVEAYEDTISEYETIISNQQEYVKRVSAIINESRELINQLDVRGIFEADDDVGSFFRYLKQIQETLSNFIITDINGKSKK